MRVHHQVVKDRPDPRSLSSMIKPAILHHLINKSEQRHHFPRWHLVLAWMGHDTDSRNVADAVNVWAWHYAKLSCILNTSLWRERQARVGWCHQQPEVAEIFGVFLICSSFASNWADSLLFSGVVMPVTFPNNQHLRRINKMKVLSTFPEPCR